MNEGEGETGTVMGKPRDQVSAREGGLLQRLRRSYLALGEGWPARILVGFSGGADSLALLSLLANLGRHEGFEIHAVHVDHGVRVASGSDAQVVRFVTEALGVEPEIRVIPAGALARHAGLGREEAMRRERYRVFAQVASTVDAGLVARAHHQRDQAETVLLHMLRGSGIRGASGMRRVTTIVVPWWEDDGSDEYRQRLTVWRPLLDESAHDLRSYAESLELPIVEDASNDDVSYRRNAIRHDVLPILEGVAPGATLNLARFASLAAVDSDELDRQARLALEAAGQPNELDRQWLLEQPLAIRRRVVQFWIASNAPVGLEVSANRIDEILRVASVKERPRTVEIGNDVAVRIAQDVLTIYRSQ